MKKKEKTSKWGARAARSLRATARPIDFARLWDVSTPEFLQKTTSFQPGDGSVVALREDSGGPCSEAGRDAVAPLYGRLPHAWIPHADTSRARGDSARQIHLHLLFPRPCFFPYSSPSLTCSAKGSKRQAACRWPRPCEVGEQRRPPTWPTAAGIRSRMNFALVVSSSRGFLHSVNLLSAAEKRVGRTEKNLPLLNERWERVGFADSNNSFPDVLIDVCFQATRLGRRKGSPNQRSLPDRRTCKYGNKRRDTRREIRKASITCRPNGELPKLV
jgi:hypothetical protein